MSARDVKQSRWISHLNEIICSRSSVHGFLYWAQRKWRNGENNRTLTLTPSLTLILTLTLFLTLNDYFRHCTICDALNTDSLCSVLHMSVISVSTRLYTGPALCIVILLNLDTGPALCSSILKWLYTGPALCIVITARQHSLLCRALY